MWSDRFCPVAHQSGITRLTPHCAAIIEIKLLILNRIKVAVLTIDFVGISAMPSLWFFPNEMFPTLHRIWSKKGWNWFEYAQLNEHHALYIDAKWKSQMKVILVDQLQRKTTHLLSWKNERSKFIFYWKCRGDNFMASDFQRDAQFRLKCKQEFVAFRLIIRKHGSGSITDHRNSITSLYTVYTFLFAINRNWWLWCLGWKRLWKTQRIIAMACFAENCHFHFYATALADGSNYVLIVAYSVHAHTPNVGDMQILWTLPCYSATASWPSSTAMYPWRLAKNLHEYVLVFE